MDMEKVEEYTERIDELTQEIALSKTKITVLNNLQYIEFKGTGGTGFKRFTIGESHKGLDLESQSLEVFKTLAIKELETLIKQKEKTLAEFIKKGITDNDN